MTTAQAFSVVIDNLPCIATAYSEEVAGRVLHEVWRRLEVVMGSGEWVCEQEAWGLTARYVGSDPNSYDPHLLEIAIFEAAMNVVEAGRNMIVAGLSVHPAGVNACRSHSVLFNAAQYRLDMAAASMAYAALTSGTINFAEQPVVCRDGNGKAFYHECLIRLADSGGCTFMPSAYLEAIERLGLTRAFDCRVLREVVTALEARPDAVLGCNLSGLSVANDIWWFSILGELRRSPDIAKRLVVEVTETALPPETESALELLRALQEAGCRVALDDFGAGYSTIAFARAANADIIKIDGSYVHQGMAGGDREHLLHHLVSLAEDFAADIVVEGIESEADLQVAYAAGVRWFQGYLFKSVAYQSVYHASATYPH